jgi:succinate dehydrogenase / fumarate reductase, flavoprotein subunit
LEVKKLINEVIEADMLAIGGAGAVSGAAIAARRFGLNVVLVSKGGLGRSGNSIMAHAAFSMDGKSAHDTYSTTEANPSFTKERLFEKIIKQSYYLSDQNIVEQLKDLVIE